MKKVCDAPKESHPFFSFSAGETVLKTLTLFKSREHEREMVSLNGFG